MLLLCAALLLGGCALPIAGPLPAGVEREREVRYTPEDWPEALAADVYHRPGASPAPAVLLIHGGSWQDGGPVWSMNGIARKLARRGYVVVNAQYRGTPAHLYPAPVQDLRETLRWMRANAAAYGIDPERISTFGFSAGAHLAAQVALADGNPGRVRAIVAGGAPFDLTLYPGEGAASSLLGGRYADMPGKFRAASPVSHVTRASPPIFIYHGTRDTLVPPEHARRMQAAYRAAGSDAEIHWLEGRGHSGTLILPGEAVDRAIEFLDRVNGR